MVPTILGNLFYDTRTKVRNEVLLLKGPCEVDFTTSVNIFSVALE